jgi:diketogulonate reductase-like aldo/keto reductase
MVLIHRSIGVSNFSLSDTQALLKTARIKPSVNQIKLNPYTFAEYAPLIAYSAMHGIQIAAYSSLASISRTPGGPVDKPVADAAKRLGATPAQVLLAWARAKGAAIVTTSGRKERLQEYLDAAAFVGKLSVVEIAAIDAAGALGPPKKELAVAKWAGRVVAAGVIAVCGAWQFGYL